MLARYAVEQRICDLRPRGIISTSMMLLANERQAIEAAFGCKVTDRYGSEEVALIACECERTKACISTSSICTSNSCAGWHGGPCPVRRARSSLRISLTAAMPVHPLPHRDVGVPSDGTAAAGAALPLMERVTGRVADYLKRRDGSMVAGVSLVERTLTAIRDLSSCRWCNPPSMTSC